MSEQDDRDYKVGKGKPPKKHQFKPGQSGNPEGGRRHKRRKPELALREMLIESANEEIPITKAGRRIMMRKKEALIEAVINDALTGTPAHRLKAFRALDENGAFSILPSASRNTQEARHRFLERLAQEAHQEGSG